jgi:hypothetical protein
MRCNEQFRFPPLPGVLARLGLRLDAASAEVLT